MTSPPTPTRAAWWPALALALAVMAGPVAAQPAETEDPEPGPRPPAAPSEPAAPEDARDPEPRETIVYDPPGRGSPSDRVGGGTRLLPQTERQPVVYTPPRRGAPRERVAGGIRAIQANPHPKVLVPKHVGLTSQAAPSLFWHLDGVPREGTAVVFTLIEAEQIEPLAEVVLPTPAGPGIYRVRLSELGVRLTPGVEYEWSIALVYDAERRSSAPLDTGSIQRETLSELSGGQVSAARYASLGLWYDALGSLCDALEADPQDSWAREQRSSLLRQAQLNVAVE